MVKEGRTSTSDNTRPETPSVSTASSDTLKKTLDEDCRISVREIAEKCCISKTTAHKIITEQLSMTKVYARWVPRPLNADQMKTRVNVSKSFVQHYRRGGDRFLQRIVTTDETWFHFYDQETKQESMVWKSPGSPQPKKARVAKSVGKQMFIIFMDAEGVILAHAVPQGEPVNSEYYSKTVRRDMLCALRKKRPHMAENIENVLLHQDNAPCHTSHVELDVLGIDRLHRSALILHRWTLFYFPR